MDRPKEIQLSERLQTIASHVATGETVADIGTDHGYIPISLLSKGITSRVILTDIHEGPLLKARGNFRKWLPEVEPDLRQGPGLSVLQPGEADVLIIAGMGGILISRILDEHPDIVHSASRLVLQPRNHAFTLREYLRKMNRFLVSEEQIVLEVRHYCEIITLTRRDLASDEEIRMAKQTVELETKMGLDQRIYNEVPVMHVLTGNYRDYLDHKCRTEQQVIRRILEHGRTDYAESRRQRAESRMNAFRTIRDWHERMADKK